MLQINQIKTIFKIAILLKYYKAKLVQIGRGTCKFAIKIFKSNEIIKELLNLPHGTSLEILLFEKSKVRIFVTEPAICIFLRLTCHKEMI